MQKFLLTLILFLPLVKISASELRFECPIEIKTSQTLKDKTPEGWANLQDSNAHQWLNSITVFDGPPQELASLVPDNESNSDWKKSIWTFNKIKKNPIWFTCNYLKTDIVLAKALPLEITQCHILFSKGKSSSILGLVCK